MTVSTPPRGGATTPGAVSHTPPDWISIDWYQAQRLVRRLQARIVQAAQAGRWGKVRALQHLLTHSYSAKVLAVRRVTENPGKHTPGVDGVTWTTPEQKQQAVHTLRQRGYHPQPLRRIYIPKSPGKVRPLSIATLRDRAMQTVYLQALDPVAEVLADPNSYGFRVERSPADALAQAFIVLGGRQSAEWVLEGDIQSCFDRISHDWMLTHIPMDKVMLQKWLKAGYQERGVLYPTEEGAAQGGPLSPVLANLTLNGLERMLQQRFSRGSRTKPDPKVNAIRFADDFIVTGRSKDLLENEVKPLIEAFLQERGLVLSPQKTCITHIEEGFDFLGQQIRKFKGKPRTMPSRKSVKTLLTKVREIVKTHKHVSAGQLIALLNPLLRGWALYHRHAASKRTFNEVDAALFTILWRWAKRRHPTKNRTWVRKKYFHTRGGDRWVFAGELPGAKGQVQKSWLYAVAALPIRRHTKVRAQANPYDPAWEVYFEERLGLTMAQHLSGRRKLLHLWKEQGGLCPICQHKITTLTGWHNHHIVWRSHGGSDSAENRVLLHPTCHRQVHSQGLTVVKPRSARGV
jgi:RNA-directed DNA polymerase